MYIGRVICFKIWISAILWHLALGLGLLVHCQRRIFQRKSNTFRNTSLRKKQTSIECEGYQPVLQVLSLFRGSCPQGPFGFARHWAHMGNNWQVLHSPWSVDCCVWVGDVWLQVMTWEGRSGQVAQFPRRYFFHLMKNYPLFQGLNLGRPSEVGLLNR